MGDLLYIVMEFVDGASLRDLIREGRLSPAEAMRLVPQVCDAMQYAHDQGVVHRDIKPENILIDQDGSAKVADFGLAKVTEAGAAGPDRAGGRSRTPTTGSARRATWPPSKWPARPGGPTTGPTSTPWG